MEEKIKFWHIFFFCLLISEIKSEDKSIIEISEDQGYDITNPDDDFFNDICMTFSSENNADVTLEYRRKYYYYPNYQQKIITNNKLLNKEFSKPKRINILSCFSYFMNNIPFDNLAFTVIIIFSFFLPAFSFFFFPFWEI